MHSSKTLGVLLQFLVGGELFQNSGVLTQGYIVYNDCNVKREAGVSIMDEAQLRKYQEFRKSVDTTKFTTEPYVRRIEKPWGYEIHFTQDSLPYFGKQIFLNEGAEWSLQVHDQKQESWLLASGNLTLLLEDSDGEMQEIPMQPGQGYTSQIGQKHRMRGGPGGGSVFEVSTPELGNTYRLEDRYQRTTETPETRESRNALGHDT